MKSKMNLWSLYAGLCCLLTFSCKDSNHHGEVYESSIVVYNAAAQAVTVNIYRNGKLYLNFHLLKKGSFYYDQGSNEGLEAPYFSFSDSAIFTFADGKRKKDVKCTFSSDPNCRKDTTSLFNEFIYQYIYNSDRDVTFIYNITHKDYAEAK